MRIEKYWVYSIYSFTFISLHKRQALNFFKSGGMDSIKRTEWTGY
jgi:hypothetical protein